MAARKTAPERQHAGHCPQAENELLDRKIGAWEKNITDLLAKIKKLDEFVKKARRSGDKIDAQGQIIGLWMRIDRIRVSITDAMKKITAGQDEIIEDLRRRDNFNDGPSAPPSKDTITRKQARAIRAQTRKKSGKKQGAQPGHKGATRKRPKPTKFKDVKAEKCPKCGSKNLTVTQVRTEDRTNTVTYTETTRYNNKTCRCDDCGAEKITAEAGIPRSGTSDTGLIKKVVEDHHDRIPVARIRKRLMRQGIFLSDGTIQNIITATSEHLVPISEEIKESIRSCSILCIDETSVRFKNKLHWLWIFYDPQTGITFFTIDPSRGHKVVEGVLGPNWDGIIVCDGWSAYNGYNIQRCNAHLIREMETLANKNPKYTIAGRALSTLRRIYHDAKMIRDKSEGTRAKYKRRLEARTRGLVRRYADDPVIGWFMAKLGRAVNDMFKFVLDPRIPPTNNAAEAGLREYVILRRIRGAIRSERSLTLTAARLSCTTTWQNTGKDPIEEIIKMVPMI